MTCPKWFAPLLFAALSVFVAGSLYAKPRKTGVIVNRLELSSKTLNAIHRATGTRIPPGRYWYDRRCGAWGYEGQGVQGFVQPKLKVGGRLHKDASRGQTGVFVNGRQLATSDVRALTGVGIPVYPGRYWLDADGTGGLEDQPASFNLLAMIRARQPKRRRRLFSTYELTGISVMSDGSGVYAFQRDGHSFSSTR